MKTSDRIRDQIAHFNAEQDARRARLVRCLFGSRPGGFAKRLRQHSKGLSARAAALDLLERRLREAISDEKRAEMAA